MRTDLRMVAPSLVTETFPARSEDCRILSMPLGPSEVFTRSATASAPQMEDCRGEGGAWWAWGRDEEEVCVGASALMRRRSDAAARHAGDGQGTHHATLLALGHLSALLEDVHRGEGIGDHGSLRARVRATAVSEERRSPKGGGARAEALKRRRAWALAG